MKDTIVSVADQQISQRQAIQLGHDLYDISLLQHSPPPLEYSKRSREQKHHITGMKR
jgi:hypothetical protein